MDAAGDDRRAADGHGRRGGAPWLALHPGGVGRGTSTTADIGHGDSTALPNGRWVIGCSAGAEYR